MNATSAITSGEQTVAVTMKSSNLLVTSLAKRRKITGLRCCLPDDLADQHGDVCLIEPVFYDFRAAGSNELGFPFIALGQLQGKFKRITLFLNYSQENALVYKGYVTDVRDALASQFKLTQVKHIPYPTCGSPLFGSVLALTGSNEPFTAKSTSKPMMPSEYFPELLAHVPRNRPNFPIVSSSRFIGAVRSDLNLLPPLRQWAGRSLMCEYRQGKTTEIRRMRSADVGRLFGVNPCAYTDDLHLAMPVEVLRAFLD